MNPQEMIDDMAKKFSQMMSGGPMADFEKNMKVVLAGFFDRLNLVSREEYDAQTARLAALEARVTKLEQGQG